MSVAESTVDEPAVRGWRQRFPTSGFDRETAYSASRSVAPLARLSIDVMRGVFLFSLLIITERLRLLEDLTCIRTSKDEQKQTKAGPYEKKGADQLLAVALSASMVVSMNAPIAAWADTGEESSAVVGSQVAKPSRSTC
ncbi:MAG: hypothetical protein ACLTMP_03990 [Eggerthella lenta]